MLTAARAGSGASVYGFVTAGGTATLNIDGDAFVALPAGGAVCGPLLLRGGLDTRISRVVTANFSDPNASGARFVLAGLQCAPRSPFRYLFMRAG